MSDDEAIVPLPPDARIPVRLKAGPPLRGDITITAVDSADVARALARPEARAAIALACRGAIREKQLEATMDEHTAVGYRCGTCGATGLAMGENLLPPCQCYIWPSHCNNLVAYAERGTSETFGGMTSRPEGAWLFIGRRVGTENQIQRYVVVEGRWKERLRCIDGHRTLAATMAWILGSREGAEVPALAVKTPAIIHAWGVTGEDIGVPLCGHPRLEAIVASPSTPVDQITCRRCLERKHASAAVMDGIPLGADRCGWKTGGVRCEEKAVRATRPMGYGRYCEAHAQRLDTEPVATPPNLPCVTKHVKSREGSLCGATGGELVDTGGWFDCAPCFATLERLRAPREHGPHGGPAPSGGIAKTWEPKGDASVRPMHAAHALPALVHAGVPPASDAFAQLQPACGATGAQVIADGQKPAQVTCPGCQSILLAQARARLSDPPCGYKEPVESLTPARCAYATPVVAGPAMLFDVTVSEEGYNEAFGESFARVAGKVDAQVQRARREWPTCPVTGRTIALQYLTIGPNVPTGRPIPVRGVWLCPDCAEAKA